jgi:hypothetical protein
MALERSKATLADPLLTTEKLKIVGLADPQCAAEPAQEAERAVAIDADKEKPDTLVSRPMYCRAALVHFRYAEHWRCANLARVSPISLPTAGLA